MIARWMQLAVVVSHASLAGCDVQSDATAAATPTPNREREELATPGSTSVAASGSASVAPSVIAAVPASVAVVRWPLPSTIDRDAFAGLDAISASAVRSAPVPVLVVRDPLFARAARVMAGPHWVALAARADGLTVSLSGTRLAHRHPGVASARGRASVRGQPAFVTQNERIWSASWLEYGAAYVLEVECDQPSEARCNDDRKLMELAATLRYVGGAGDQP
ncbi:MAG: hypothetical protein EXR75_10930 [Myxococcales bacterium]|nr:hypothetical protein [Myxococcales bacterium]